MQNRCWTVECPPRFARCPLAAKLQERQTEGIRTFTRRKSGLTSHPCSDEVLDNISKYGHEWNTIPFFRYGIFYSSYSSKYFQFSFSQEANAGTYLQSMQYLQFIHGFIFFTSLTSLVFHISDRRNSSRISFISLRRRLFLSVFVFTFFIENFIDEHIKIEYTEE